MTLARHIGGSPDSPFDGIRHEDESGNEYWLARELMPLLGYPRWNEFKVALERAQLSCKNTQNTVTEHFSVLTLKNPKSLRGRNYSDYKLSRYGAYLTAMNGDPRKPEIAAAQSYFAIKTRESEVRTQQSVLPQSTPEERLSIVASVADKFGIDLTNPRIKQGIQDYFFQTLGITPQPLLFGEKWVGVAERAEELGFGRIGADLSKRVRLGQWVSKCNLERRKETRLVNGTNQGIWCYKVCDELDEAISSFFGGSV